MSQTIVTVELSQPIEREGGRITSIQLRQPNSGELRGLSLVDVTKLEIDTLFRLIPRISVPFLTEAELAALPPTDLLAISTEIAGFFVPGKSASESPT